MTAKDLIKILKNISPETRILIDGYEYDYDDPGTPSFIQVRKKGEKESYTGEYEDAPSLEGDYFDALLIPR